MQRTSGEARWTSAADIPRWTTPTRLLLQQRGPHSLRRHVLRAFSRVALLLSVDLGIFVGLRALVRFLRDDAVYGTSVAVGIQSVFPRGMLAGTHFVTALLLGLAFFGAYRRGDARRDVVRLMQATALAVALALWSSAWEAPLWTLLQASLMLAIVWSALAIGRLTLDAFLRAVYQTPADGDPMVFVGDKNDVDSRRVHDRLVGRGRGRIGRWVDVPQRGEPGAESPNGYIDAIHDALTTANADTIVLCGEYEPPVFEAIVETATSAGIRVLAVPRVSGVIQQRSGTVWYNGAPFVELTVPGLRGSQLVLKRAMDLSLAALGLLLLSPLFAIIAILIKVDSRGPVFFSQERVGYAGRIFRVWKFRTMRRDADGMKESLSHLNASGDPRLFKIPEDPRVTVLGRLLRKWSIDELPQLLNVVSGEMSLVGPRPFFESDLKTYHDHHLARLGAKPGITGLWQVKGRSSVTDFEEVVRLDREYIDRWSVALDLWILLITVPAVLRGRGAY